MSEKRFPLEFLHAEALCREMPSCGAVVVFTGKAGAIPDALKCLYPQSHSRVFYMEDTMENRLPEILSAVEKLHVPCLVMHPQDLPGMGAFLPSDARVSLVSRGTETPDHLSVLLDKSMPDYFTWIGFQRYLANPAVLEKLSDHYIETLRLGEFRKNHLAAEPLLREATHHFIDMRCMRYADLPDLKNGNPNGLYAEEICALARYMGLSNHFQLAVIYGYPSDSRKGSLTAQLMAQLIWHLTEGLAVSVQEHPGQDASQFHRKAVQMGEDGQELVFLQSRKSGRWWMELPNCKQRGNPFYISCAIDDYVMACKGEIPLKWLLYYQKSNNFS